MRVLSIGEVLWDVFPDREFLGGAPLNVCANLRRAGDEPLLFSALGNDDRGAAALEQMSQLHLTHDLMQQSPDYPTGTAVVTQHADGEASFVIPRPSAFDGMALSYKCLGNILHFAPDWLYMGTLLQTEPRMEDLVMEVMDHLPDTRSFYDMNLRKGHWDLALVERLCHRATVLKLNDVEARLLSELSGRFTAPFTPEGFCRTWAKSFSLEVICMTLGPEGCYIYTEREAVRLAGYSVSVSDTVGAGDAFAAGFLHAYHRRWPLTRCGQFANALGALVASRPGATPLWTMDECTALSISEPLL